MLLRVVPNLCLFGIDFIYVRVNLIDWMVQSSKTKVLSDISCNFLCKFLLQIFNPASIDVIAQFEINDTTIRPSNTGNHFILIYITFMDISFRS